jgi:signal transduction histidine kinase
LYSKQILEQLSFDEPWVETVEDKFDVVGAYLPFQEKSYYGISKAYDTFGYSKLEYLRNVLLFTFFLLSGIVILISYYLSQQISKPLTRMAMEIAAIKLDSGNATITIPETKDEINFLGRQFNELMMRLKDAFSFQKHAIQHISHELKTPIAILVSNFEKMERETDPEKLKKYIGLQKEDTRNLSNIINALLEISKTESGNVMSLKERVRLDDILYDLIGELKSINDDFDFEVSVEGNIQNEDNLTVSGNKRLLISAFMNLMMNCVSYSANRKAEIRLISESHSLRIIFKNYGLLIQPEERQFLFQHFFRGANSKGKRGFGLGLVLIHKIIHLHNGEIFYQSEGEDINIFNVILPLS